MIKKITPDELGRFYRQHDGIAALRTVLECVKSPADLLHMLAQYLHFSSIFMGAIPSLAGVVASSHRLFRKKSERAECLADRSAEVAMPIFVAVADEFRNFSHREFAQEFLRATGAFLGFMGARFNRVTQIQWPDYIERPIHDGYGMMVLKPKYPDDEYRLLRAIGFHVASETLAAEEFQVLNRFLRERFSELVVHLEKTLLPVGDGTTMAYEYVAMHCSVEEDHASNALEAANRALVYYAGRRPRAAVRRDILMGVQAFTKMHCDVMRGLLKS